MDMNIERDLKKEERTSNDYLDEYAWNTERDGLFIKRTINYHETIKKIAMEVLGDQFEEDNPKK